MENLKLIKYRIYYIIYYIKHLLWVMCLIKIKKMRNILFLVLMKLSITRRRPRHSQVEYNGLRIKYRQNAEEIVLE